MGAKPYQIDRMLRQMGLAGKFDGVTGFIFGEMLDCTSAGTSPDLQERGDFARAGLVSTGRLLLGLRSGHVSRGNVTLPMGIEAELILEGEPEAQVSEAGGVETMKRLMQEAKAHSSDRYLRYGDGVAGGVASAAGASHHGSDQAAYPPMSELLQR